MFGNKFIHSYFIDWLVCHFFQSKRYKRLAGASKAGTPYSWNILSVDFELFCKLEHTAKCGWLTSSYQTIWKTLAKRKTNMKHAHTHTHLTLANLDSSDVVNRMLSCNAFDTHRHPQTDDALHKHNLCPWQMHIVLWKQMMWTETTATYYVFLLRLGWMYVLSMLASNNNVRKYVYPCGHQQTEQKVNQKID